MVEPLEWQKQPGYQQPGHPPADYQRYPPPGYPQGYPPPGYPQYGYRPPAPGEPKPSNNIGWAVAAVLLFWPLAIPAFYFAVKADEYWYAGNRTGAAKASHDAKVYGRLGVIIGVAFVVLALLFFGVGLAVLGAGSASVHTYSG